MPWRSIATATVAVLIAASGVAHAQTGIIAGAVRDTTGAVLPGVTVEAASPSLIEKVRVATTDGEASRERIGPRKTNRRPGEISRGGGERDIE